MRISRAMGHVAEAFDEAALESPARAHRHRPHPLLDRGREQAAQRAADPDRLRARPDRHRAQRQPGQRRRAARRLVRDGSIFQTSSDTEVVLHLYARSREHTVEDALIESISQIKGAFSFALLTKDRLIAARDPHGFRPLCARASSTTPTSCCSETCALDLIGATYVRDVEPGEVLIISDGGLRSLHPFPPAPLAHCIFEHVYFARPDSYVFGRSVNDVRTQLGRILARGVAASTPTSSSDSRLGRLRRHRLRRRRSGIPMAMGLIRNHYVGRTFIQPQQAIRHFSVRIKLNPVRSVLEGRRVILIDDSIVRGTTSRKIVKMVRAAGAKEVHMRIACPPTISPCFYGVDTPNRSELIAATHSLEQVRDFIEADTPRVSEPRGAAARGDAVRRPPTARPATPACIRSRFRRTSSPTGSSRSRPSSEGRRRSSSR